VHECFVELVPHLVQDKLFDDAIATLDKLATRYECVTEKYKAATALGLPSDT
jgi:hypothetical protein